MDELTREELAERAGVSPEVATPGQTLVTDEVVALNSDLPVRFREIGPVELKGVPKPVRLHEAVLADR